MKTLVLTGGGHAHLHCLQQLATDFPSNCRVLLISPSRHQYYSGMFSGFTEDVYSEEEIRIDLKRICEKVGAEFVTDQVVAVNAIAKQLTGANGAIYDYDLVSFDIGSTSGAPSDMKPYITAIKPNFLFPDQLRRIRETETPAIVGGGASGVELAFSINAWRKQQQLPANTLLFSATPLLAGLHKRISRKIESIARQKDLSFFTNEPVETITPEEIITSSGQLFPQTEILWLTGPKSFPVFRDSGLDTDPAGFLLVNECLQNVRFPEIFGAGDCITIQRYPNLPKNGVYAVRQGPILWRNLKSRIASVGLEAFNPQERYVSILSTGGGEAFLTYGDFSAHGKVPWLLKKRIDRNFMEQYKKLYE
ncbi:FAD-dependent oxidoreductase [Planomicrobium okeanokoites]|uniref:FAD-dependent oxidoreductase n=1 Tax=Planomicrobium okeanokoites TaxID=244 RepID=UPI003563C2CF